jgi:hypothetical protein
MEDGLVETSSRRQGSRVGSKARAGIGPREPPFLEKILNCLPGSYR